MPALPKALNRSSSSSDEVISDGSSSFTSSYNRYPFSLPTLISWRTSSYFSSIDKVIPPLRQSLNQTAQIAFFGQERIDVAALRGALALKAIDLTLDRGPLPFVPRTPKFSDAEVERQ